MQTDEIGLQFYDAEYECHAHKVRIPGTEANKIVNQSHL
jgi:hypothetical protein